MKASSARSDPPPAAARATLRSHAAALSALLLVTLACLVPFPGGVGSLPALLESWPLDKIAHGVAFLVLPAFLLRSARELHLRRPLLWAALVALGYGIVLELVQRVLHYRQGEIGDAFADAIGVLLFVGWISIRGSGRT